MNISRAAVLEKLGQPLVIKNIELPPLLPGQILVKVLFSGVCRSQIMEARGGRGNDPWLPHLLGHEGSGIVLGVGEGCHAHRVVVPLRLFVSSCENRLQIAHGRRGSKGQQMLGVIYGWFCEGVSR